MSETSGANKKPKPVNQHVRTFREGAVAANVFARQAPGGFEYLDFSLSRAWKSANGKEGYSQNFFASNRAAILNVISQACDFIDTTATMPQPPAGPTATERPDAS